MSPATTRRRSRWAFPTQRLSIWRDISAPQLFAGSFLLLILLGTLGLKLIPGIYTGEELGWLGALFTATSAVCVTGLIVVNTATFFTPLGQGFILLLVQMGGLGIITFTTLIILALGRRLSLRQEALATGAADIVPQIEVRHLTRDVLLFTFLSEIVGALLLYLLWSPELGYAAAVWPAFFHAVSAFCNAGFSTFSDNLISFQDSSGTLLVIMALIVIGGIGFLTLEELYLRTKAERQKNIFRVSLHSRIVLATTALLIVLPWPAFAILEWTRTLADLAPLERTVNALMLSVTPRTAGFNAIDYGQAADSTNFLTILLMSIGGSPGSTAGGLKTTTFTLLGLLAWSRFRGQSVTSLWGRSVPEETIQRAVGLFVVAFGIVTIAILILTTTEAAGIQGGFLTYMFEAVSAFNTVGLSMGVTADLSRGGQWVMILLMYIGRVGPLTFAAAIALRTTTPAGEFRYAYEDVVVG